MVRQEIFLFPIAFRPDLGPTQASSSMSKVRSFPRGAKRSRREASHSFPPIAEVKNSGAIPPLLHIPSWRDA
jgi:hypothetical protein